jgi:hypothetical protein
MFVNRFAARILLVLVLGMLSGAPENLLQEKSKERNLTSSLLSFTGKTVFCTNEANGKTFVLTSIIEVGNDHLVGITGYSTCTIPFSAISYVESVNGEKGMVNIHLR